MSYERFIGRTLGDLRKELSGMPGTIKIGCQETHAFFFCGEKASLTPMTMGTLERYCKEYMDERVDGADTLLRRQIKTFPTIQAYVSKCWSKDESIGSLKGYIQELYSHWKGLGRLKGVLYEKREQRDRRTEIYDRKVVKAYPSVLIKDELILIIEGYETAGAWDMAEYVEFVQKRGLKFAEAENALKGKSDE